MMNKLTLSQMKQIYIQLQGYLYWGEKLEHVELNHVFKKIENDIEDYYLIFSRMGGVITIHFLNFGNVDREIITPDSELIETLTKYINQ